MAFLIERLRAFHARYPRLAPHLAVTLAFAPLLMLNLELSDSVASTRLKLPDIPFDTAKLYSGSVQRTLSGIRDSVGNPASWPHNWIWALRHEVPIKRYDTMVGGERLYVTLRDWGVPGKVVKDGIKLDAAGLDSYAVGPWRRVEEPKPGFAWARQGARLVIPIFAHENVHILFHGKPPVAGHPVTIRVNDVARTFTPTSAEAMADIRFDVPEGTLVSGTNQIRFDCPAPTGLDAGCFGLDALVLVYQVPSSPK